MQLGRAPIGNRRVPSWGDEERGRAPNGRGGVGGAGARARAKTAGVWRASRCTGTCSSRCEPIRHLAGSGGRRRSTPRRRVREAPSPPPPSSCRPPCITVAAPGIKDAPSSPGAHPHCTSRFSAHMPPAGAPNRNKTQRNVTGRNAMRNKTLQQRNNVLQYCNNA